MVNMFLNGKNPHSTNSSPSEKCTLLNKPFLPYTSELGYDPLEEGFDFPA